MFLHQKRCYYGAAAVHPGQAMNVSGPPGASLDVDEFDHFPQPNQIRLLASKTGFHRDASTS
jgi:hypothetical protein